jgi:hypothetical protein
MGYAVVPLATVMPPSERPESPFIGAKKREKRPIAGDLRPLSGDRISSRLSSSGVSGIHGILRGPGRHLDPRRSLEEEPYETLPAFPALETFHGARRRAACDRPARALAVPAAAAPPASVDVTVDKVSSIVDGDFVFATMAGETELEDKLGRLALDIFLTNEESFPVEIVRVTLHYDDPASSQVFQGQLRMRCDDDTYLRQELSEALLMPPGVPCRLGVLPDPLLDLPAPGKLQISIAFEVNDQPIFSASC